MPVIRISDQAFSRLQKLAEPFVDTPGSVIERILDHYEKNRNKNGPVAPINLASPPLGEPPEPYEEEVPLPNPDRPPDLSHTRILSAQFNGQNLSRRYWNHLVHVAHQVAFNKLGNFEAVRPATRSNIVRGRKPNKGFYYDSTIGVSIQRVGSTQAWSQVLHLARRLNVPVSVEFEWRHKAPAAYRDKRGSLDWPPQP